MKSTMEQFFLGIGGADRKKFQDLLEKVTQIGMKFRFQAAIKSMPISSPDTVIFQDMPDTGISSDQLLQEFERIAAGSANWGSPNFMGFPDSGNSIPALSAAVLTPFLNQNMANQDICAPMATFVEMEVVHWLRQNMSFKTEATYSSSKNIGGVLTLGGCLSNSVALMAAREFTFPNSRMIGMPVTGCHVVVLVPDVIEHYSVRSVMAWLSLGESNVVRVPVDDDFRMDLRKLQMTINDQRGSGKHILACVAYAGDSRSMRVDNLHGIAEVLRQNKIWFHVDACHGSQLAFSRTHRHKIRGIEKADSVTIDPHKVLWIPNTCSFVLFKDPASLSNISTNSDLILKTQWSLGQVTPFIGSKAFDALKLWATIRFFGRDGIEKLIDGRLELTRQVQEAIRNRPDLVLLNETDINSCMFVYIPKACQQTATKTHCPLTSADMEKINDINLAIKIRITEKGESYCHGFNLKRCPNTLWADGQQVYVLRTMNGNPLTGMEHVNRLLDSVVQLGQVLMAEHQFHHQDGSTRVQDLSVGKKLKAFMESFFGNAEYQAVAYGSSTSSTNKLLSDIDMMVFVGQSFPITPDHRAAFEAGYREIMEEEGIKIDAEVPFATKQLVPLDVAQDAACGAGIRIRNGEVVPIIKSPEYLGSPEMLYRLILNVLTVPNAQLGGSSTLVTHLRKIASGTLVKLVQEFNPRVSSADEFVQLAQSNGKRSGEDYLGYKERLEIVLHLQHIWDTYKPSNSGHNLGPFRNRELTSPMSSTGCVIFLNGFPGTGKCAIARATSAKLPRSSTRLIDNHLLIDVVEATVPGRGPHHKSVRKKVREVIFEALVAEFKNDRSITAIMTGCLAHNEEDIAVLDEHLQIARDSQVPFYLIDLECDIEEHKRRFGSPARYAEGKTKLSDEGVLEKLLEQHTLLDPTKIPNLADSLDLRHRTLSTTELDVEQSSIVVLDYIGKGL